ncbi:MAG: response regulator transcription factor [Chloroflexi bacterium]|nr:response regulator transcription factor [Chloroflexota bacterium]
MSLLEVLLVSSRPAIQQFFQWLGQLGPRPFVMTPVPADVEALARSSARVETASVALLDVVPDPAPTIEICRRLRAGRPALPIVALFCCGETMAPHYLQAMAGLGVPSLVDLHSTLQEIADALDGAARGEAVVHLRFGRDRNWSAPDLLANHTGPGEMPPVRLLSDDDAPLLILVEEGLSDEEIGQRMNLSRHTVRHRLERLRKLVGARNRTALAGWRSRHRTAYPWTLHPGWLVRVVGSPN